METHVNLRSPVECSAERKDAYVLFMDIPGYSKLSDKKQKQSIEELYKVVTLALRAKNMEIADVNPLPTGDGMCLCFFSDGQVKNPEAVLDIATDIARQIKALPSDSVLSTKNLRICMEQGPLFQLSILGRTNVAGATINKAQRIMDFGDAGHILLSSQVADKVMSLSEDVAAKVTRVEQPYADKNEKEYKVCSYLDGDVGNAAVPPRGRKRPEDEIVQKICTASEWTLGTPQRLSVDHREPDPPDANGVLHSVIAIHKQGSWPKDTRVECRASNPDDPSGWRIGIELRDQAEKPASRLQFHIAPVPKDCCIYGFDGDAGSNNSPQDADRLDTPQVGEWNTLRVLLEDDQVRCYVNGPLFHQKVCTNPQRFHFVVLMAWGAPFEASFRNLQVEWGSK